ncbi:MAG: hypothetical protein ACK4F7_02720 [Inhella sp.]
MLRARRAGQPVTWSSS